MDAMIKTSLIQSTAPADGRGSHLLLAGLKCVLAVTLAIAATAMEAGTPPLTVSFDELVNHPQRYNGKRVSVRAYVVTSCVHCKEFWASVQAARDSRIHDSRVQNWIVFGDLAHSFTLPKQFSERLKSQDYDGYVRVTGTFQYVHMTRETALSGFGWGRLDDKQITHITELRPLGPPIPARIN